MGGLQREGIMRTLAIATGIIGLGALWCVLVGLGAQPASAKKPAAADKQLAPVGFAVVELFTSEGCSSCPPADVLATKIAKDAKEKGQNVQVLAMHVDYWDRLGWKDRFASAEFSARQRAYAAALGKHGGDGGVYTPEMVVNGASGFVGSDSGKAREAIDKALAEPARVEIKPTIAPRKAGEPVRVAMTITGDAAGLVACAALVESGLRESVKAGENRGRTLEHERVVRAFATHAIKEGAAEVSLTLPEGVKEENCRVVVFVQDEKTMLIGAAAEVALTNDSHPSRIPANSAPDHTANGP